MGPRDMHAGGRKPLVFLLFVVTALFLGAGCGDDEADDIARLEKMEKEITALIGEAACGDSTDCRYIAFGAKPCGGPWRYLVYSAAALDTVELAFRVAAYNELNRDLNRRYGWMSDCSVPEPPNPGCRGGKCVDVGEGANP
jgi:hypothetical protein